MIDPENINYRDKARRAFDRSKAELAANDDDRLPYAVLLARGCEGRRLKFS
jgi:hypothetical protein